MESYISGQVGQLLCKAQRREHSLGYVTGVATLEDCKDEGAKASQEQLPKVTDNLIKKYDFIWLTTYRRLRLAHVARDCEKLSILMIQR